MPDTETTDTIVCTKYLSSLKTGVPLNHTYSQDDPTSSHSPTPRRTYHKGTRRPTETLAAVGPDPRAQHDWVTRTPRDRRRTEGTQLGDPWRNLLHRPVLNSAVVGALSDSMTPTKSDKVFVPSRVSSCQNPWTDWCRTSVFGYFLSRYVPR